MRDFLTSAASFAGLQDSFKQMVANDGNDGEDGLSNLQQMKSELYFNLKKKVMKVGKQKIGDKVSLNPQLLKDLYKLVMLELTPTERASIAIYEL